MSENQCRQQQLVGTMSGGKNHIGKDTACPEPWFASVRGGDAFEAVLHGDDNGDGPPQKSLRFSVRKDGGNATWWYDREALVLQRNSQHPDEKDVLEWVQLAHCASREVADATAGPLEPGEIGQILAVRQASTSSQQMVQRPGQPSSLKQSRRQKSVDDVQSSDNAGADDEAALGIMTTGMHKQKGPLKKETLYAEAREKIRLANLSSDEAEKLAREQAIVKMREAEKAREDIWSKLNQASSAALTASKGNAFLQKLRKSAGHERSGNKDDHQDDIAPSRLNIGDVKRSTEFQRKQAAAKALARRRAKMRQVAVAIRLSKSRPTGTGAVRSREEGRLLQVKLQAAARAEQGLSNLHQSPPSSPSFNDCAGKLESDRRKGLVSQLELSVACLDVPSYIPHALVLADAARPGKPPPEVATPVYARLLLWRPPPEGTTGKHRSITHKKHSVLLCSNSVCDCLQCSLNLLWVALCLGPSWEEFGRTETVRDGNRPQFVTAFVLDYYGHSGRKTGADYTHKTVPTSAEIVRDAMMTDAEKLEHREKARAKVEGDKQACEAKAEELANHPDSWCAAHRLSSETTKMLLASAESRIVIWHRYRVRAGQRCKLELHADRPKVAQAAAQSDTSAESRETWRRLRMPPTRHISRAAQQEESFLGELTFDLAELDTTVGRCIGHRVQPSRAVLAVRAVHIMNPHKQQTSLEEDAAEASRTESADMTDCPALGTDASLASRVQIPTKHSDDLGSQSSGASTRATTRSGSASDTSAKQQLSSCASGHSPIKARRAKSRAELLDSRFTYSQEYLVQLSCSTGMLNAPAPQGSSYDQRIGFFVKVCRPVIDGGSSVSDFETVAVSSICWQPAGSRRRPIWPPMVVDGHRLCYHDLAQQCRLELYRYRHSGFHVLLGHAKASVVAALSETSSQQHQVNDSSGRGTVMSEEEADMRELKGLELQLSSNMVSEELSITNDQPIILFWIVPTPTLATAARGFHPTSSIVDVADCDFIEQLGRATDVEQRDLRRKVNEAAHHVAVRQAAVARFVNNRCARQKRRHNLDRENSDKFLTAAVRSALAPDVYSSLNSTQESRDEATCEQLKAASGMSLTESAVRSLIGCVRYCRCRASSADTADSFV
eukprot:SAG31_NODE_507_length_14746_cov_5.682119_1_plen_1124_part_00